MRAVTWVCVNSIYALLAAETHATKGNELLKEDPPGTSTIHEERTALPTAEAYARRNQPDVRPPARGTAARRGYGGRWWRRRSARHVRTPCGMRRTCRRSVGRAARRRSRGWHLAGRSSAAAVAVAVAHTPTRGRSVLGIYSSPTPAASAAYPTTAEPTCTHRPPRRARALCLADKSRARAWARRDRIGGHLLAPPQHVY